MVPSPLELSVPPTSVAEVVPETILGLPAHPLIVHAPVVLVPLATIGALLALLWARSRNWSLPVTAVLALGGLVGVQLAMWSGENLESSGEHSALIEHHSELAAQARPIVLLFAVLAGLAAWAGITSARGRDIARRLLLPLCALSLLSGALATTWIGRTGHTGAKSVWSDERGGSKDDGGT
ncbi:MAG: hypothetical protein JO291_12340 [Acidimicrobiia bacterium]|nr:hypothetical protein [Acidimicrobiia bacterium]